MAQHTLPTDDTPLELDDQQLAPISEFTAGALVETNVEASTEEPSFSFVHSHGLAEVAAFMVAPFIFCRDTYQIDLHFSSGMSHNAIRKDTRLRPDRCSRNLTRPEASTRRNLGGRASPIEPACRGRNHRAARGQRRQRPRSCREVRVAMAAPACWPTFSSTARTRNRGDGDRSRPDPRFDLTPDLTRAWHSD